MRLSHLRRQKESVVRINGCTPVLSDLCLSVSQVPIGGDLWSPEDVSLGARSFPLLGARTERSILAPWSPGVMTWSLSVFSVESWNAKLL